MADDNQGLVLFGDLQCPLMGQGFVVLIVVNEQFYPFAVDTAFLVDPIEVQLDAFDRVFPVHCVFATHRPDNGDIKHTALIGSEHACLDDYVSEGQEDGCCQAHDPVALFHLWHLEVRQHCDMQLLW